MENGLAEFLMQAIDPRFTGSWEFCFLFMPRPILASEDLMILTRGNVTRCFYSFCVCVRFDKVSFFSDCSTDGYEYGPL